MKDQIREFIPAVMAALVCILLPEIGLSVIAKLIIALVAVVVSVDLTDTIEDLARSCMRRIRKRKGSRPGSREQAFNTLLVTATLTQKRHTLSVRTAAGRRAA